MNSFCLGLTSCVQQQLSNGYLREKMFGCHQVMTHCCFHSGSPTFKASGFNPEHFWSALRLDRIAWVPDWWASVCCLGHKPDQSLCWGERWPGVARCGRWCCCRSCVTGACHCFGLGLTESHERFCSGFQFQPCFSRYSAGLLKFDCFCLCLKFGKNSQLIWSI